METREKINSFIKAIFISLAFSTTTVVVGDDWVSAVTDSQSEFAKFLVKLYLEFGDGYGIEKAILTFLCATGIYRFEKTYSKEINRRLKTIAVILSCIFSFFMIFGKSFKYTYSCDLIFANIFQVLISLISGIGFAFLFYPLISLVILKMKSEQWIKSNQCVNKFNWPVWKMSVVLLAFWMPYIIAFYPGTINWDAMLQLKFYQGVEAWTSHHPIMSTGLMGVVFNVGRYLIDDNFGIFLYTFIQTIISSILISYSIKYMEKLKINYKIRIFVFLWFALFTMWPINAYTLVKDTSFYLSILWYTLYLIRYISKPDDLKKCDYFGWMLSMLLVYYFRNNGIFIIVITTAAIIAYSIKKKRNFRKLLVISVAAIIVGKASLIVMTDVNNIKDGSIREALSIPFQQTARYVCEYSDEVTIEEKKVIDAVLDYDLLNERYTPETSDPVKDTFKDNCTKEQLKYYFIEWAKMLVKHPGTYIEATMNGAYGYFYPDRTEYKDGLGWYELPDPNYVNYDTFNIHFVERFSNMRDILERVAYTCRSIPLIGIAYSNGIYSWIVIFLTMSLIYYKKYSAILAFVPAYLTILVCVASPVNAFIRYMLPVMVVTPLMICWTLYIINKK